MVLGHILLTLLLTPSMRLGNAAPIFGIGDTSSSAPVSTLSSDQTSPFIKPARFSQVAYCSAQAVLSWNCGPPCDALPGIEPIVAGGDDGLVPMYFIAHDPTAGSIVIAHEGTDPTNIKSLLNDAEFNLKSLDPTLFPNVDSSIKTHDGFAKTFARTANEILGNVTALLQSKGVNQVEIHGHSLGAAIAVLDAMFLRQMLDPSISITTTVFGLPRAGNQAWADFVDQNAPGLVHIHNRNDLVGTIPPRVFNYQHPSGEIHIQQDSSSVNCPGQENGDKACVDGQSLLSASIPDHLGPYFDGISLGKANCDL